MNRIKLILIVVSAIFAEVCLGGVYITPKEYDNLMLSNQSEGIALIKQTTANLSGNSYTIGGQSVKYRCVLVDKINCVASTPELIATISEVSLRDPTTDSLVTTFASDVRIEEDASTNKFYLCGAAYGGEIYDTSTLTTTTDASGNTIIDYNYIPNSKADVNLYFTNLTNSSSTSYMIIHYHQVCR